MSDNAKDFEKNRKRIQDARKAFEDACAQAVTDGFKLYVVLEADGQGDKGLVDLRIDMGEWI